MASLTPAVDLWLDNPMVTGYGFPREEPISYPYPTEAATCPRCHLKWLHMPEAVAENIMRPWEAQVGGVWITAPDHPVGSTYCRGCAIQAATCKDLIAYVEAHNLQQQAIEYAIIASNDWERKLDPEWVPWLWDAMKIKLYTECRMRDFLQDEHADEFTDWMMERG